MRDVDTIVQAYLGCALWTEELELEFDDSDFSEEDRAKAQREVEAFLSEAGEISDWWSDTQIGHDLWLTRNGYGSGFWDRHLEGADKKEGNRLAGIAKKMGEAYVVLGDDGRIYYE